MNSGVEIVRHFNRTVTRAIGIFGERYLGRPRPLAASRLVFEIGENAVDVRTLRKRLGLDSGYLSRLLRRLEREMLIRIEAGTQDRRIRRVALTKEGRAELAILNRLSDAAAGTLLEGLPAAKRPELLAAMQVIDRVLMSRAIEIEVADFNGEPAQAALLAYYAELNSRFDSGFNPREEGAGKSFVPPDGLFLEVNLNGEIVGCGALRFYSEYAEIKRMWVDPRFRGLGIGTRILGRLEKEARHANYSLVRLDTNGSLSEAQALYARAGYRQIPRYNDNPYAQHWYEKRLPE